MRPTCFARISLPLFFLLSFSLFWGRACGAGVSVQEAPAFSADEALRISQEAVGRALGAYVFLDPNRQRVALADFKGKPLLISLVYTSCYRTCSIATQALASVVEKARDVFGTQAFTVVSIGFDVRFDTPKAMGYFARQQGVSDERWHFLSGDADTLGRLVENIGFSYVASPKGFDHVVQTTIVDAQGVVYQQLYGEVLSTPALLEPLKTLILGTPPPSESSVETLVRRVRLFCTTYDPSADAYRFDYSLFVGLFVGATIILTTGFLLFREMRRAKKTPPA